jgi:ABC-type transporter Mla maintaining outer membrane lipid asymmetry ATPase subunit MlaF
VVQLGVSKPLAKRAFHCEAAWDLNADRRRNRLHLLQIVGTKRRACSHDVAGVETLDTFGAWLLERAVRRRCGALFQQGALFSSLTVSENEQFPMREHLSLSDRLRCEVAMAKIEIVGLRPDDAGKYPSELSGGMN